MMLHARCLESDCGWTFSTDDPKVMQAERDQHFDSHFPPGWKPDRDRMPRFPPMSDDTQVSTGHVFQPRPVED